MRKQGILHSDLAARINRLGHMDTWVVADCGLPVPPGTPIVDLALVFGTPTFRQVVEALLREVVVEAVTIADATPPAIRELLPDVELTEVTHEQLKGMLDKVSFVVRTGETTPYANVIFHSGVAF